MVILLRVRRVSDSFMYVGYLSCHPVWPVSLMFWSIRYKSWLYGEPVFLDERFH